ncbi:DUF2163 domain-containing protein [Sphingomonas sp.]|uniref:DUF2163 domain-containing protein n=1 Tax=Sphingomonas sp. TaxID=28214 RepID=UPI0025FA24F2|nr:DUF2163 domain-containing protein [Sphingomonas sp.]
MIDGEATSLALCWRLERADGAGIALTSHDEAVLIGNDRYEPEPGIVPASVSRRLGLDAQTSEISGGLSSDALDETELTLGRWDGARAVLVAVDWSSPDRGETSLLTGEIGQVQTQDGGFSADLNGAAAALDRPICPSTSPQCRAELGDAACRIDLRGRSARAIVAGSSGGELTLEDAVDSRFLLGRLRYLSGSNCGLSTVIIGVAGDQIRVRDLPRAAIEEGCRVELREGCDKTFATCRTRFANAANFRGEPYLPGNDLLTRYPGA